MIPEDAPEKGAGARVAFLGGEECFDSGNVFRRESRAQGEELCRGHGDMFGRVGSCGEEKGAGGLLINECSDGFRSDTTGAEAFALEEPVLEEWEILCALAGSEITHEVGRGEVVEGGGLDDFGEAIGQVGRFDLASLEDVEEVSSVLADGGGVVFVEPGNHCLNAGRSDDVALEVIDEAEDGGDFLIGEFQLEDFLVGILVSLKAECAEQHGLDCRIGFVAEVFEEDGRICAGGLAQGECGIDPDFGIGVLEEGGQSGQESRVLERAGGEGGAGADDGVGRFQEFADGVGIPFVLRFDDLLKVGALEEIVGGAELPGLGAEVRSGRFIGVEGGETGEGDYANGGEEQSHG